MIFLLSLTSLIPTFLGNEKRNFYGEGPVPEELYVLWKVKTGVGRTGSGENVWTWTGTGWTGQGVLVEEDGKIFLLIGSLDHRLRKIDAETGEVVWEYEYDDVIKATPTIAGGIVICGSRKGFGKTLGEKEIYSLRGISLRSGEEIWRMNIERTGSYSRDCDGSALIYNGKAYIGAENGIFYCFDPFSGEIHGKLRLFEWRDVVKHKGNVVVESSPSICDGIIYITAGSGYLFGIEPESLRIVWRFYVGSDLDGSPVVTSDGFIIFTIEKQYIEGKGGVMMVDPKKPPEEAVVWFFPTGDRKFCDWEGGVIGSASINDYYNPYFEKPRLCAFQGIDGYLYLVSLDNLDTLKLPGPDGRTLYPVPELLFKEYTGGGISTPILVDDYLISGGYDGKLRVYRIYYEPCEEGEGVRCASGWYKVRVEKKAEFQTGGSIESTPVVWHGKIFIGSRGGYIYCLGKKEDYME